MKKRRSHFIDLTGRKFGHITVLGTAPSREDGYVRWHGRCDCGAEKTYYGHNLRNGTTKSCGCQKLRKWTPETLQQLVDLRQQGVSRKKCALALGVTFPSVVAKINVLRIMGRL